VPSPPPRPPAWEERAAERMLAVLGPKLPRIKQPEPPEALRPFDRFLAPRRDGGMLDATWFPAEDARGAVLLAPPWLEWGQAYFHRRGRIEALRAERYHVLTFDLAGFGRSTLARRFRDIDVEEALDVMAARAGGLPQHLWGVSSGGYWAHPVLALRDGVTSAVFEDVSPHLIEYGAHRAHLPLSWLGRVFPRAYAFEDLRQQAPHLRVERCLYVGGARDAAIRARDFVELARLAPRGELLLVPGAAHLGAIKASPGKVIGAALRTFGWAKG